MKKLLIIFFLIFTSLTWAQNYFNNQKEFSSINKYFLSLDKIFSKSFSINILPGAFIPVNLDEEYYIGPGIEVGLQYNTSELISLCFNYNLYFSKAKIKYPEEIRKRIIMQFEFGPKFNFYKYKNFDLYILPETGAITIWDEKNKYEYTSLFPVCFSLETGIEYKLSKKISLKSKIKYSTQIGIGLEKSKINTFLITNSGINIIF